MDFGWICWWISRDFKTSCLRPVNVSFKVSGSGGTSSPWQSLPKFLDRWTMFRIVVPHFKDEFRRIRFFSICLGLNLQMFFLIITLVGFMKSEIFVPTYHPKPIFGAWVCWLITTWVQKWGPETLQKVTLQKGPYWLAPWEILPFFLVFIFSVAIWLLYGCYSTIINDGGVLFWGARFSLDLEPSMTIKEVKEKAHEPSDIPGTRPDLQVSPFLDTHEFTCGNHCVYLICAYIILYTLCA